MAIITYHTHDTTPPIQETLAELSSTTISTRALLSMLGDYWTNYYKGTLELSETHSGFVAAAGRQLTKVYELLLSSNILDFPVEQGVAFDLLVFDKDDFKVIYDENGEIDSYYVPFEGCDIATFQYLTTSLFESEVILVNGEHFKCVENDGIYFYVDIFSDPSILPYEYTLGDDSKHQVLLWASPIVVHNHYMYERYGRFVYRKAIDSYKYKWLLTGLMRYYTGAKSCANIAKVMDILFGIPYCRADEETIISLEYTDEDLNNWTNPRTDEASYIRITTDKRVYYTYAMATMDYGVGDTVKKNEMFGHFCQVLDYINCPYWWENEAWYFPDTAFDSEIETSGMTREEKNEIMDRLLKYNTVYFNINVAFESWDLYKQIVGELYSIIKRGFPVYLNPYIEVIFRTAFADDSDFMEQTKDCLFPLLIRRWFADPFCPFVLYNGKIKREDGFWRYYLWDHRHGRMLDILKLGADLSYGMEDVVKYLGPCPRYDGTYDAQADVVHDCFGGMFAWDEWTYHVHLNPHKFTDYVPHDDGPSPKAGNITYWEPFCPQWPYNGIRHYNGRTIHYPWGGIPGTRMTDPQRMNVHLPMLFDCVGGEPWYNGDHDHDGEIDHQPDRDFAKDLLYPVAVNGLALFDYVMGGPHYVGSHEHEGDIDHQPDRDFAKDVFELRSDWKLEYHDFFCAPYLYNLQAFFDGRTDYYLWRNTKNHRLTDKMRLSIDSLTLFDCFGYKPWYDGEYDHEGDIDHQPDRDFARDELALSVKLSGFYDYAMGCPCYDDNYDHGGDIDHNPDVFSSDTLALGVGVWVDSLCPNAELGQEFSDSFISDMGYEADDSVADLSQEFSDTFVSDIGYEMDESITDLGSDLVDSFVVDCGIDESVTELGSDLFDTFSFVVDCGGEEAASVSETFEIVGYRNGELVYF